MIDRILPRFARRALRPLADDVDLAPEDGLHPLLFAGFVVLDGPEHVAMIGERDRAHPLVLGPGDEVLDPERAVEQRVLRVNVEMNELC